MKETHLAIASVPCQTWGPIYEDDQALCRGTLFRDLDLPFYATEGALAGKPIQRANPTAMSGEKQMLCQIQQISFVLDDLTLYLDMHCEDRQALKLYQEKLAVRDRLKREFAQKFYPLTRECVAWCQGQSGVHGDHEFCWQDGPIPWEGV